MKYILILAIISALLEFAMALSLPSWGISYTVTLIVGMSKIGKKIGILRKLQHSTSVQHQTVKEDALAAHSYKLMFQTLQSNVRLYLEAIVPDGCILWKVQCR